MDEASDIGGLGCGTVHIHPEVGAWRDVSESPSTVMQLVPKFMQQKGAAAWRRVQERVRSTVRREGKNERGERVKGEGARCEEEEEVRLRWRKRGGGGGGD
jgi:hypothetical protein